MIRLTYTAIPFCIFLASCSNDEIPDDASSRIQQSQSEKEQGYYEIKDKINELPKKRTDSEQAYNARVQKINEYFKGRILSARLEVAQFNLDYDPEKQLMKYNLEPIIDFDFKFRMQKRGINFNNYSFWPVGELREDYRGFFYVSGPFVYSKKCNVEFSVDPVNAEKIMQLNMDAGIGPTYPEIKFNYIVDKTFSDAVLNELNYSLHTDRNPKNWSFVLSFVEAKVKKWEFIAQNGWTSSGTC